MSQVRPTGRVLRRSKRLKLAVPVEVTALEGEAEAFREATQVMDVNAHGGLLILEASVRHGQTLRVRNRHSQEQQECRVVNIEAAAGGKWAVGIEFTSPAETFWQISFPPSAPRAATESRE
ncbi:MAG TPA: PilZ domain-containing protein [Candidatus Acidoferrales bacterium]|nr:PilZ domain-containing protein [Candidatus Acidoferrales bacterium]